MSTKSDIIDWLLDNDEILKSIIIKTNKHISNIDREFNEEAKNQQVNEVIRELSDEMGKTLGLSSGSLYEILGEEDIRKYIGAVK